MVIKNNQKSVFYLSTDNQRINEILNKMKKNKKSYDRIVEALQLLGNFNRKTEVFIHKIEDKEAKQSIELWCSDKEENIFTFYANSNIKSNLYRLKKETENEAKEYDLSLAKNSTLTSENIEYMRYADEYNFKFGRLITDQISFYSVFLGDDVGFQINIEFASENDSIHIGELLSQLNQLEKKPNLSLFIKLFERVMKSSNANFSNIRVLAYKDFQKIGDLTFGGKIEELVDDKKATQESNRTNKVSDIKRVESNDVTSKVLQSSEVNVPVSSNINTPSEKETLEPLKKEGAKSTKIEDNKIYLDQVGYELFLLELEDAKEKLRLHQRSKGDSFASSAGDGWHDNFDFEESERTERLLLGQVRSKLEMTSRIVIIDKQDTDKDTIDINDLVSLTIHFSEDDIDTAKYLLTGGNICNNEDYIAVSINSPLGKAIYLKGVGETVSYSVNGNIFNVHINEKLGQQYQKIDNSNIQKIKSLKE